MASAFFAGASAAASPPALTGGGTACRRGPAARDGRPRRRRTRPRNRSRGSGCRTTRRCRAWSRSRPAARLGVALRPVAGDVRVRDDQHVVRDRLAREAAVEMWGAGATWSGTRAVARRAEEHVVMAAALARRGPLVAEERDGAPSWSTGAPARRSASTPSRPSRCRARRGSRSRAARPRGVAEVLLGGALALGEAGVPVGLAPEHAASPGSRAPGPGCWWRSAAVGGAHREAMHAGLVDLEPATSCDRAPTPRPRPPACRRAGAVARGPASGAVESRSSAAQRERRSDSPRDHRRRQPATPAGSTPSTPRARPSARQKRPLPSRST